MKGSKAFVVEFPVVCSGQHHRCALVASPPLRHAWLQLFYTHGFKRSDGGIAFGHIRNPPKMRVYSKGVPHWLIIFSKLHILMLHAQKTSAAAFKIAQEPVTGQLTYFTAQKIRRNLSAPLYCTEISMYLCWTCQQLQTNSSLWAAVAWDFRSVPRPCDTVKLELFFPSLNLMSGLSWAGKHRAAPLIQPHCTLLAPSTNALQQEERAPLCANVRILMYAWDLISAWLMSSTHLSQQRKNTNWTLYCT